ncbi:MAG TPA: DNA polymerase ligase N-terminal domain-containing protein, partial [Flavisolibacter sp.]
MSLSLYNQKRDFKKTAEPQGKEKNSKGSLRFVVQKHDASHVHYDFRLEMESVLKSWAVPKGPSLNPADKRLAMMVEDHPFDYRNFEGVIPEGEYGGGTVIVWDEGTYELADAEDLTRKEQEDILLQALQKGRLNILLHGKKLAGEFTLMKMRGKGERTWLLIKKNDEFSSEEDIALDERSVKSGKTIPEVAHENGVEPNHPEAHGSNQKPATKKSSSKKILKESTPEKPSAKTTTLAAKGGKAEMPQNIVPMLATLINEPFDSDDWIYEIKWDGYRAVAYCNGKDVSLVSRNLKPFTEKYAPVAKALKDLKLKAVFDGEIVAVDENGLANFQLLQNWQNTPSRLQFFVFDILWLDGKDVTKLPLTERKALLKNILPAEHNVIKYSDHVLGKGKEF